MKKKNFNFPRFLTEKKMSYSHTLRSQMSPYTSRTFQEYSSDHWAGHQFDGVPHVPENAPSYIQELPQRTYIPVVASARPVMTQAKVESLMKQFDDAKKGLPWKQEMYAPAPTQAASSGVRVVGPVGKQIEGARGASIVGGSAPTPAARPATSAVSSSMMDKRLAAAKPAARASLAKMRAASSQSSRSASPPRNKGAASAAVARANPAAQKQAAAAMMKKTRSSPVMSPSMRAGATKAKPTGAASLIAQARAKQQQKQKEKNKNGATAAKSKPVSNEQMNQIRKMIAAYNTKQKSTKTRR